MNKCCWLDINTGSFSNSFDCKEIDDEYIEHSTDNGYKLIKFECINDSKFEFKYNMSLISKGIGKVNRKGRITKGEYKHLTTDTIAFYPDNKKEEPFTINHKLLIKS